MKDKILTFENIFMILRFILLTFLTISLSVLIWFYISTNCDDNIVFWYSVIYLFLGLATTYGFEGVLKEDRFNRYLNGENVRLSYNIKINLFFKLILAPIAIPLVFSLLLYNLTNYIIYKNSNKNDTTANDSNKNINNHYLVKDSTTKISNNLIKEFPKIENTNTYDYISDQEYFCERCNEPISEEEYNNNCGLCEDCDAEVYFGERYDGDDYDLYR